MSEVYKKKNHFYLEEISMQKKIPFTRMQRKIILKI